MSEDTVKLCPRCQSTPRLDTSFGFQSKQVVCGSDHCDLSVPNKSVGYSKDEDAWAVWGKRPRYDALSEAAEAMAEHAPTVCAYLGTRSDEQLGSVGREAREGLRNAYINYQRVKGGA